MQGHLDLSFGQVQIEPYLSIGEVKFKFFFQPWLTFNDFALTL